MQTPAFFKTILGIALMAFNPSEDAQVPYIRFSKPQTGIQMVKINNAPDYVIEPVVTSELMSAKELFEADKKMRVLVNAGFFDPNNGKTISYVIKNKEIIEDPTLNESLMDNVQLQPHLDKILNRGEFRVLVCENKVKKYDIAYHNDAVEDSCDIKHSIQAGPILDERMDLEKEYFIEKNENGEIVRDSIGTTKKLARTAIGIKGIDVYLFVVTDENPMTIEELSAFMKKKGMNKALAFDGGSSTSFENGAVSITSQGDNLGRKVKSFLTVRELEGYNPEINMGNMFR